MLTSPKEWTPTTKPACFGNINLVADLVVVQAMNPKYAYPTPW